MLLIDIGAALGHDVDSDDRNNLNAWASDDMFKFLKPLMAQMVSKSLTDLGDSGPTFEMLVDEIAADTRRQWTVYRGLVLQQSGVIAELKVRPELIADTLSQKFIAAIEKDAAKKLKYISTKMT